MKLIDKLLFFNLLFLPVNTGAQSFSQKDFKLCLDNIGCSDSTLRISKEKLLNAKTISANFSWLEIRTLIIYIGEGNFTSEIITLRNPGNNLNNTTKKMFQKLMPGSVVTIGVDGYNKKGTHVDWGSLSIIITQ